MSNRTGDDPTDEELETMLDVQEAIEKQKKKEDDAGRK